MEQILYVVLFYIIRFQTISVSFPFFHPMIYRMTFENPQSLSGP